MDPERRHSDGDEREGPAPGPLQGEGPAAAPMIARVLALQRSAGNAAVTAALRRSAVLSRQPTGQATAPPQAAPGPAAPPDPRAVATTASDPAAADAMTLAEFNDFTQRQADWASQPAFRADPARTDELREVVRVAQIDRTATPPMPILAACGELRVADLRPVAGRKWLELLQYGRAVAANGWTPATTVADAVAWGEAADKLHAVLGERQLRETIKQGPEGQNVRDLVQAGAVDDFCDFVRRTGPLLTATNGMEVTSYLQLRAEANPLSYHGRVNHVRNLHHFTKDALDAQATNQADTSRAKPLALVLHAGVDHNGAFHRDPNMTAVMTSRFSNTQLIEGPTSLAAAGTTVTTIVSQYGQGSPPRAQQIMIAGHGNSRVTEMAADRTATGELAEEPLDLDGPHRQATLDLINTLIDNLATDPNARIVLNGCLTASAAPRPALPTGNSPAERAQARADLIAALNATRSLADTMRDMAARRGITRGQVSAAQSSFGSEVTLMDPATGTLGLRSPDDPALTTSDKFEYVRRAGEATGAMRAVVECLVTDRAATERAMRARLTTSQARTDWDDRVIKALYRESLVDLDDLAFINMLSRGSGVISELQFDSECRPDRLSGAPDDMVHRVFTRLEGQPPFSNGSPPLMKIVVYQVWMRGQPAKRQPFLQALGRMTANDARPYVSLSLVDPAMGQLLPDPPGTHQAGELRLALLDVADNGAAANAASVGYLRRRRAGARFANPAQITAALGGLATADAILEGIREPVPPSGSAPSAPAAGPPDPDYNLDLDGDGRNDTYVEPRVANGLHIASTPLPVLERPAGGARQVGTIAGSGSVRIIGRSGGFYAIEFGADRRPAFVAQGSILEL